MGWVGVYRVGCGRVIVWGEVLCTITDVFELSTVTSRYPCLNVVVACCWNFEVVSLLRAKSASWKLPYHPILISIFSNPDAHERKEKKRPKHKKKENQKTNLPMISSRHPSNLTLHNHLIPLISNNTINIRLEVFLIKHDSSSRRCSEGRLIPPNRRIMFRVKRSSCTERWCRHAHVHSSTHHTTGPILVYIGCTWRDCARRRCRSRLRQTRAGSRSIDFDAAFGVVFCGPQHSWDVACFSGFADLFVAGVDEAAFWGGAGGAGRGG